ncbi:hypothetical protein [Shimia sediminis]|uniref:hypothetical protein n=1 Tax=Shimia sediminis TaxID=2497945 RepID=UPI000F8D96B7|nr:hypothetical protein [Shimia sediminis]
MNRTIPHKITNCTICPHTGEACRIGFELARKLCQSITAGGDMISEDFEITGHVEMVGCMRPCTGVFHATKSSCHMFGDVEEGADVAVLLAANAPMAAVTLEAGAAPLN